MRSRTKKEDNTEVRSVRTSIVVFRRRRWKSVVSDRVCVCVNVSLLVACCLLSFVSFSSGLSITLYLRSY